MTPTPTQTNPGAGGSYLRLPDGTLELLPDAPGAETTAPTPATPEKTATPAPKD